MSKQIEALKLALEALEHEADKGNDDAYKLERDAIKEALAQPEQEPVTWRYKIVDVFGRPAWTLKTPKSDTRVLESQPLYTTPPQRTWVGLSHEEVMVAAYQAGFDIHEDYDNEDDPDEMHWWTPDGESCDDSLLKLRDLIEAKLKEKNT